MSDLKSFLTETERARVDTLNEALERKPADRFTAGEYLKLEGSHDLGNGRRLARGVYCVINWRPEGLELMRYGDRKRVDVPFVWKGGDVREFNKVPLELIVLSERAKARMEGVS